MKDSTGVTTFVPASSASDALTEVLKRGAQKLLAAAIEAEVAGYIEHHAEVLYLYGKPQVMQGCDPAVSSE